MNAAQTGFVRQLRRLVAGQAANALSDQQLLEQFITRQEQESFAVLVRRHGPMVLSVCRRVLHHSQDAEDAFQATFLVLARRAGSIRKQESVGSFLHGVAYRIAAKLRARTLRRTAREREVPARSSDSPADDVSWRELRSVLDEELQSLPEQYRSPLVLCYLEGAMQDEAARRLGWSLGTFRRRLEQARKRLGRRLARRGMTLSAALSVPLLIEGASRAAVPPLLAEATVRHGTAFALGGHATAVPTQLAALAQQNLPALSVKLKGWIVVLLAASLVAGGVLTRQPLDAQPTDALVAAVPPPAAAQPRPSATAPHKEGTVEIKGQVFDPDGKPAAGAEIFLVPRTARTKADLTIRATADQEGRFRLMAPQGEGIAQTKVLALARRHGPDWIELGDKREVKLQLAKDDRPLSGRVVDLEGQPIAGVTVQVNGLTKRTGGGDLTPWIAAHTKRGRDWRREEVPTTYLRPELLGIPLTATTGADGRFRLTGFGRERVVFLSVRGRTIESYTSVRVTTHPGPATGWATDHDRIYPASFDFAAGPSKPVAGTVRDKATGKPLAGIHVRCYSGGSIGGFNGSGYAVTDEKGRYRLSGVGKAKEYTIAVEGGPYFNVTKWHIADTPGLEPITVDFELMRGIPLRVRPTDKATGKPIQGALHYLARVENPHLKEYPGFGQGPRFSPVPASDRPDDGAYTVLALPGPGYLCVRADNVDRYIGFELKDWDGFLLRAVPGGLHPSQFHAVIPIDVSEKEPKSTNYDIALEPGRTRTGTVVGPDGKPLDGVYVAGLTPVPHHDFSPRRQPKRLKDAAFTVLGLNPRKERTLVFFHPEKKLGKVQRMRGDEKGPLTVRLEPLGAIRGRVVDAKERPRAGLTLEVLVSRLFTDYKELPWELLDGYDRLLEIKQRTDDEGCFRVEGLLPGLRYNLVFAEGEIKAGTPIVCYRENLTVEHGKTKDLGDLQSETKK